MGNFFTSLFSSNKGEENNKEKIEQKNFDILKYDGVRAQKIGKHAYAIKCFNEALNLQEDFETLGFLVTSYTVTNQLEEALEAASRMVGLNPDNTGARLTRIQLLFMLDRDKEVIDDCQHIIQAEPENYIAFYQMAKAKLATGDQFGAIADLTKAITLKEDFPNAYLLRAEILKDMRQAEEALKDIERIYIVACGSAYHVGMAGKYVLEDLAGIPVEVDLASEFRYRNPIIVPKSLVIVVSQSGETADSLAALRLMKEQEVPVLGIVNVVGSSIARESDYTLYTYAGPEISVATTKAYSTQLIAMYLLAIEAAKVKGVIDEARYGELLTEMETLPSKIQRTLDDKERIQWFASKFANAKDIFFIGRGLDYAISLEGSLKMKEISYIHSEAYAAGELKHGPISLVENGILVVGVLTQSRLFEKTLSNMVEVKSRGAYLMGLTTYGHYNIEDTADFSVYVPKTEEYFATSLAIVPLQLMGYYVSVAKGLDVDKPRNLAKSVTVE